MPKKFPPRHNFSFNYVIWIILRGSLNETGIFFRHCRVALKKTSNHRQIETQRRENIIEWFSWCYTTGETPFVLITNGWKTNREIFQLFMCHWKRHAIFDSWLIGELIKTLVIMVMSCINIQLKFVICAINFHRQKTCSKFVMVLQIFLGLLCH